MSVGKRRPCPRDPRVADSNTASDAADHVADACRRRGPLHGSPQPAPRDAGGTATPLLMVCTVSIRTTNTKTRSKAPRTRVGSPVQAGLRGGKKAESGLLATV